MNMVSTSQLLGDWSALSRVTVKSSKVDYETLYQMIPIMYIPQSPTQTWQNEVEGYWMFTDQMTVPPLPNFA